LDIFLRYINPYFLNALAATGLTVLYYVFRDIFRERRKDTARFFGLISAGWLVNLIYLNYAYQNSIPAQERLIDYYLYIEYIICAVSDCFFLLGSSLRLRRRYPSLFRPSIILGFTIIVISAFFLDHRYNYNPQALLLGLTFSTIISTLFDFLAIFSIGIAYYDFFLNTPISVEPRAKWALVLSILLYAFIQFGYLIHITALTDIQKGRINNILILAGMLLKLLHIYGLSLFSRFFFEDYEIKRKAFVEAKLRGNLFDKLAHELNTPATELRLRISELRTQQPSVNIVISQLLMDKLSTLTERISMNRPGFSGEWFS